MQQVVVGVSASASGESALDWGLQQALLRELPLTAVRAWEIPSYGGYYSVGEALRSTSPDFELSEVELARTALDQAVARVPGAAAVEVTAVARRGRPAEVLVEAARGGGLLVVGTRGVGALSRVVHLGSVSSSVLHHATGPVAVVPEQAHPSSAASRVVVGLDGSQGSQRALRWAVAQARLLDAVLVPVAVHGKAADAASDEREQLVAAAEAAGAGEERPVRVEPDVRTGHTGAELIAAAGSDDLLVLGSRGRGGFSALLLGSTSSQVAGHARCPVVVVRPD